MTAPGSGNGIVSAQTNALEGAQTGFVGLLQQDIFAFRPNLIARYVKALPRVRPDTYEPNLRPFR